MFKTRLTLVLILSMVLSGCLESQSEEKPGTGKSGEEQERTSESGSAEKENGGGEKEGEKKEEPEVDKKERPAITKELFAQNQYIPNRAYKHMRFLIREARRRDGLNAPIPAYAAQIHQESYWRPEAESSYALGLTQFTPDTAEWMAEIFSDIDTVNPLDPRWAMRAMIRYDRWLLGKVSGSDYCNQYAFALSAYNGGLGWVRRDKKLAEEANDNPDLWWDNVAKYSNRADWALEENRNYIDYILLKHQPHYVSIRWGGKIVCPSRMGDY